VQRQDIALDGADRTAGEEFTQAADNGILFDRVDGEGIAVRFDEEQTVFPIRSGRWIQRAFSRFFLVHGPGYTGVVTAYLFPCGESVTDFFLDRDVSALGVRLAQFSEEVNGLDIASTGAANLRASFRGDLVYWPLGSSLYSTSGAIARVQVGGMNYLRATSAATIQSRITTALQVPLNYVPSAYPTLQAGRRTLRRYRFTVVARLDALAATPGFVAISQVGSLVAAGNTGVEWKTVAGLWEPHYRRNPLGVLVVGPASVPADGTPHVIGFEFVEGPLPTVKWIMDGQVAFVVSDPAGVGSPGSVGLNYRPGYGTDPGAVGTRLDVGDSWIQLWEIPG
jgi:hypothetical protein